MWPYKNISREDFEKRKDYVDKILQDSGCKVLYNKIPYEQKTTMHSSDFSETWFSHRPIYEYGCCFYRIDEVLFRDKPFIVLEYAETIEDVMNNKMEDTDPFPYDLSDKEMIKEIRYSLGMEPHP